METAVQPSTVAGRRCAVRTAALLFGLGHPSVTVLLKALCAINLAQGAFCVWRTKYVSFMGSGSHSKQKGASFERSCCTALSLWVTNGKLKDLFWRSAMSGGRATVAYGRGEKVRQAGDITAVAAEGHVLTSSWYVECKAYRDLDITSFLLTDKGKLAEFWRQTKHQAEIHGRLPMLIAKQNFVPALVVVQPRSLRPFVNRVRYKVVAVNAEVWLLDEMLRTKFTAKQV